MIKESMKNFRMMTKPIKKASGGDMDWSNIDTTIAGTNQVVPTIGASAPMSGSGSITDPSLLNPTQRPSIFSSLGRVGNSIAPFASNIINGMRTPPQVPVPHLDNMVTLRSPSFNAERNSIERNINADASAAAMNVDGNTGAKIRLFATGQKLDRLSDVNQRDVNTRLQTQNEQARINTGISTGNNRKLDEFGQQQVERSIAQQNQQSANLSNLSDKIVGIQNENEKRRVDLQKTRTMSTLFSRSGVGDRERKLLKAMGVDDPLGQDYKDVKRNGGFFRGLPLRAQTLKSLYKAPN